MGSGNEITQAKGDLSNYANVTTLGKVEIQLPLYFVAVAMANSLCVQCRRLLSSGGVWRTELLRRKRR